MSSPTFAQNYIGEFATDVAAVAQLTVQGITLTAGMWYFDTTLKTLREYDGTNWFSALRADGVVAMTDDLDMGTKAITNVGLVDGVDVSAVGALAHAQQHSITSAANHTSAATPGQVLQADASGLPVDATNTDAELSATVLAAHARSHSITSAVDHSSTATPGRILQANGNGLPANATNTDAQVSATVTASHTRSHAMDSASDHSAATQGDVPYAGAAGAWSLLGAGTAGQKLTTGGGLANPSWTTGQSQTIDFSQGSDTVGASVTTYYKANAVDTGIDECEKPVVLTDSPVMKTFVVNVTTNTRPNNTVFTVMKNGVATALTVTFVALATGVQTSTGSIACVRGDKIAVRIVTGATAGTLSRSCATVLITN